MYNDMGVIYVDEDGNIRFGWDNNNVPLIDEGPSLVQKVVLRLFTQMGTNAYASELGSYFYELIGGNFTKGMQDEITSVLNASVDVVKQQIMTEQLLDTELEDGEKLNDLTIDTIEYDNSGPGWVINILVISEASSTFFLSLNTGNY